MFVATGAKHVIPGHGEPTDMMTVTAETKGYLTFLQNHARKLLDEDLGLEEAYEIDQSAYRHLDTFEELAKKNAGLRQTIKVRINFNNREDSRAFYNIGKYIVDV